MLNKVLTYLTSLRLSLIQWAFITTASIMGGLVVALKIQGGQLHEAQIKLLLQTIRQSDSTKETAVIKAKEALQLALKDYYDSKE